MTQDEQHQVDQLREQLDNVRRHADESRVLFSSALHKSNDEVRLYRGLFWCLLALASAAVILNLLQR
jgi:hypothetical protein